MATGLVWITSKYTSEHWPCSLFCYLIIYHSYGNMIWLYNYHIWKCAWLHTYLVQALKLFPKKLTPSIFFTFQVPFAAICFSFYCYICFTPSTQCSSVIFILYKGYSLCQIQFKTGLKKSTIERIMKEMDINKKKSKRSHSSKLSYCGKQYVIYLIITRGLNYAVQAINFTNNILINPIIPKTVRNMLKANNICFIVKKKCPLLK